MEASNAWDSPHENLCVPEALLDAGDESWNVLHDVVTHRMADLARGQVLEIVSVAPDILNHVQRWCWKTGHRLAGTLQTGHATRIWVRKW